MSFSNAEAIPAKTRGRKSKQYLLAQLNNAVEHAATSTPAPTPIKKVRTKKTTEESSAKDPRRGRKTKPTKISSAQQPPPFAIEPAPQAMRNVILFLKCTRKDLNQDMGMALHDMTSSLNASRVQVESHDILQPPRTTTCTSSPCAAPPEQPEAESPPINGGSNSCAMEDAHIARKITQMKHDMYGNNVHKSCACFWDTHEFDTPPVYIPKYVMDDVYHVYGCFCSPSCAASYLMAETTIDSSEKFERYQLLNSIYSTPNVAIQLAPDPRYMLHHFYGRLSIGEYRQLSQKDKVYTVVDKPMTRIMPEIYEEHARFIFSSKTIL